MYSVHERIARDTRVALECLERAFPTLKPLPINLRQASFPPLQLGAHNIDVELRQLKCSENTSRTLSDLFARAVQQLTRSACDDFRATLQEIEASAVDGLATEKCWEVSLRKKYTQAFEEDVGRLRESLLDLVRSSFAKVEAAKRERDRDSSGQFTDEVVDILVQAFEETPSVSKADRLILTEATGLNDRQILTWFANQRQRRLKKSRQDAAPYSLASRRTSSSFSSRTTAPRRDFSSSSTQSSDSDISVSSSIQSWISNSSFSTTASSIASYTDDSKYPFTRSTSPLDTTWELASACGPNSATLPSSTSYFSSPSPSTIASGDLPDADTSLLGSPVHLSFPTFSLLPPPPSFSNETPRGQPLLNNKNTSPFPTNPFYTTMCTTSSIYAPPPAPEVDFFTTPASPSPSSSPSRVQKQQSHSLVSGTAPFLEGFDFELAASDPLDGEFWSHFITGGGSELLMPLDPALQEMEMEEEEDTTMGGGEEEL